MNAFLDLFRDGFGERAGQWIASLALIASVVVLRGVVVRILRQSQLTAESRRRWFVQLRTAAILAVLFGLAVIWAAELRTVAFSLVAVAVALTIAVKELLLGLSGALVRTSSRAFSVGDRIQVGDFRGDVVDMRALSTQILEVDESTNRRTGRAVTLPNSLFLDKAIVNETFASNYVLSVLAVPVPAEMDWQSAERVLLEAANDVCAPFLAEAKERVAAASNRLGLDPPIVEPTVSLVYEKAKEIRLLLRYPTPVRWSNRVSQAILRRYLAEAPLDAASDQSLANETASSSSDSTRTKEPNSESVLAEQGAVSGAKTKD
jgi:small-conductance mechanosensitive channel